MKISRFSQSILSSVFIVSVLGQAALAQNQAQPSGGYPLEQSQPVYAQPAMQPVAPPYGSERAMVAPQNSLSMAIAFASIEVSFVVPWCESPPSVKISKLVFRECLAARLVLM